MALVETPRGEWHQVLTGLAHLAVELPSALTVGGVTVLMAFVAGLRKVPSKLAGASARPAFPWRVEGFLGQGSSATVWLARRRGSGQAAALKVGRNEEALLREVRIATRVGRRWGPALLGAGRIPEGLDGLPAGAPYLALERAEGEPLDPLGALEDRELTAALVAHGVGRALAELHDAGVRHGDVKPANIVVVPGRPKRDAAADRVTTLLDLGLAGDVARDPVLGGTPRYLAPELRVRMDRAGPEADLYALGLVLAEILDPEVLRSADPQRVLERQARRPRSEPMRWAEALLSRAPGGRPSAQWIADRAARFLHLEPADAEDARARKATVRRAYLATRARDLEGTVELSEDLDPVVRGWLDDVRKASFDAPLRKSDPRLAEREEGVTTLGALGPLGRARWLVALVGPAAASWPLAEVRDAKADPREMARGEGELVARLLELCETAPPNAWTLDDVAGSGGGGEPFFPVAGAERVARLVAELSRPMPPPSVLATAEDDMARGDGPPTLGLTLASAFLRLGQVGRAWTTIGSLDDDAAHALAAEIARRRGDRAEVERRAARALASMRRDVVTRARCTLARLHWDAGDGVRAEQELGDATGPAAAEVRALLAYRRGAYEEGLRIVEGALPGARDAEACARLEATRGMLEHGRGVLGASLEAFGRAVDMAARAGAVLEEATYRTGEAAAASDVGAMARALGSATRAALLWERLGRPAEAARAWLARAGALSTMGATFAADEAAREAIGRAEEAGDVLASAYARWAQVEVRSPRDPRARALALEADGLLADGPGVRVEDRVRSTARLLVWAPDMVPSPRVAEMDRAVRALGAPARWEWWGARAHALVMGAAGGDPDGDDGVLTALLGLVGMAAPLGSRGPALDAAVRLAKQKGEGEAVRRLELSRREAARALRDGTPAAYLASLDQVAWVHEAVYEADDVTFAPAQVAQLEVFARSLGSRDRLRPLFEQVLDTLILWTGVERGLLLLRGPDGRLMPRVARNIGRRDLRGEQLALSQTLARRALETGDAVVATDALSTMGDMHASVHALRLRSVLAVPLIARGESLGVVYLDDRARRGAFGATELAWVRVVASQAAMAIADARDQVLLRRAVRKAEGASRRLQSLLAARDAELDAARAELAFTREREGTRFRYDAIVGRSEPMEALLKVMDRITVSDVPVLFLGESGTGKELLARALHENGARGKRAFVTENCSALPEPLLESALFGHVRGAFTGASSTRAGLFDVADGGTLFLDEIGEMSLAMQAKLLRAVQDGEIRSVGGERTRRVDVRVVGATHRDLEAMVKSGAFREDLFYRLNVITVRVPPLRERPDDVPLLVAHFLEKHATGRKVKITRGALDRLVAFPWPGNVRQLENELRRALVLGGERIDEGDLSAEVARRGGGAVRASGVGLRARVDALESDLVKEALRKHDGNQTKAAEALGLSRFGLQKMMKRLGIR